MLDLIYSRITDGMSGGNIHTPEMVCTGKGNQAKGDDENEQAY
jgi:hypothetical protein